ncbi:Amidase-like protein 11 [Elsinoe fawcettii]|nr:Amidase-like protein 11 [Elsinoe fawcettii]
MPEALHTQVWQDIAKRKKEQQEARLPSAWMPAPPSASPYNPLKLLETCNYLTAEVLDITDIKHDATDTLSKLSSRALSATTVVTAFCKRAAVAHRLTNCLTEILFDQALDHAKYLDDYYSKHGQTIGPLHGLPITVKDHMDVAGVDSSSGMIAFCFDEARSNSQLVEIMIAAGAVVIAKTNVPQTCMTGDTYNNIFGRTCNAHNSQLGAGGSSGGEGAAVAMGASLLGLGSDAAGSIRVPAAVNGVVGYKPSGYRIPADGRAMYDPGVMGLAQIGPVAVFGFLGRSIRDVKLASKIVADAQPWMHNPFLYPSPWLDVQLQEPRQIRIGLLHQKYLSLSPPISRGYLDVKQKLAEAGFQLIDVNLPDISKVWDLCKDWFNMQGIQGLYKALEQEPITETVRRTGIIRAHTTNDLGLAKLRELNIRLATLNMQMAQVWSSDGKPMDLLLSVVAAHTALPFDEWQDMTLTALFNAIDWPAIAVPLALRSDATVDIPAKNVTALSDEDARLQTLYNTEDFDSLPLSAQIIGRRFEDEKLLTLGEMVHGALLAK